MRKKEIFIDVETSGIDPAVDRVIKIELQPRNEATRSIVLKPPVTLSDEVSKITGMTNDDLAKGLDFGEIAEMLLEQFRAGRVLTWNADFDIGFIDAEYSRYFGHDFSIDNLCEIQNLSSWYGRFYGTERRALCSAKKVFSGKTKFDIYESVWQTVERFQDNTLTASIRSAFAALPAKLLAENVGDGAWTLAVKRALIHLGKELGCYTCASGVDADSGEWLWDVTWGWCDQRRNDQYVAFTNIPFACESEFGNDGDIVDDFPKLLCADVGLALMVIEGRTEREMMRRIELCSGLMRVFDGAPRRKLMIACYSWETKSFHYFDLSEDRWRLPSPAMT